MRIGIDGPQCSGKTTLWSNLKQSQYIHGDKFDYYPEISRVTAPKFGVQRSEDWRTLLLNKKHLRLFFDAEIEEIAFRESRSSNFICDSSLFLTVAFIRVFLNSTEELPEWGSYDLLFYCEPQSEFVHDGFRFEEGRSEVETEYWNIIDDLGEHRPSIVKLPLMVNRLEVALAEIGAHRESHPQHRLR